MRRHARFVTIRQRAEIFGGPNVARLHATLETHFVEIDFNVLRPVEAVENADSF